MELFKVPIEKYTNFSRFQVQAFSLNGLRQSQSFLFQRALTGPQSRFLLPNAPLLLCSTVLVIRKYSPRVCPGSCRIDPALFPGQRSYETTKNGFSLLFLFSVVVFLCSGSLLAFVVLGLVSSVVYKRLAGKNVSKMIYLC